MPPSRGRDMQCLVLRRKENGQAGEEAGMHVCIYSANGGSNIHTMRGEKNKAEKAIGKKIRARSGEAEK